MTNWSDSFSPEEIDSARPWSFPDVGDADTSEEEPDEVPLVPTAEEIEDMITQAQAEATERGLKEGRERGFMEGYKKGEAESRQQAREALQSQLEQLNATMKALAQPLEDLDKEVEEELVALAMAVARQLVRREIRQEPGEIVAVVREALAALPSTARQIRLQVHPDDAVLIREAYAAMEEQPAWRLQEDASLTRGGCMVVSESSRVDASYETRLNAVIAQALGVSDRQEDRE